MSWPRTPRRPARTSRSSSAFSMNLGGDGLAADSSHPEIARSYWVGNIDIFEGDRLDGRKIHAAEFEPLEGAAKDDAILDGLSRFQPGEWGFIHVRVVWPGISQCGRISAHV